MPHALTQNRMSLKFLCSVKQIPVGGKYPASESIAKAFGHIDHFWIEIADPLHFIFL